MCEGLFNKHSTFLWEQPLLLSNLFLVSYETDFMQERFRKNEKKLALYVNFTLRYTNNALVLKIFTSLNDFQDRAFPIIVSYMEDCRNGSYCKSSKLWMIFVKHYGRHNELICFDWLNHNAAIFFLKCALPNDGCQLLGMFY